MLYFISKTSIEIIQFRRNKRCLFIFINALLYLFATIKTHLEGTAIMTHVLHLQLEYMHEKRFFLLSEFLRQEFKQKTF